MNGVRFAALLLLAYGVVGRTSFTLADDREDRFEARIRPVLAGTCFRCHGAAKTSGDLRVDSRASLVRGGESGAAIVPGKPDESLLIRVIQRHADVSAMPPDKDQALRADQIADFVAWIKEGAVWPHNSAKFAAVTHWAFEALRPSAPQTTDREWGRTSIDAYIRAPQEAAGVAPLPPADKLTLIRRATFDLTGLPPTPEEVETFLRDDSPAAFANLIERLLASTAYGEKWGRHWLDVVRYADTAGETADYPVPVAWRYRNYVIDAFNADKPYDEFVREQIAGDILADQGPREEYAERVTATGYLAISRRFGFDSENYHHLTIQDSIDTLGQSVLGLSLGCARCHDHKFDPVSMRDYYALYGIFASSRYAFPGSEQKQKVRSMVPLVPPAESLARWRTFEQRVASMTAQLTRQKQPVPTAVLRSLHDMDGDFELQAPAAGGSKGVLVPPWVYEGEIAVTTPAQSPFQNLYPAGRVGVSIAADADSYSLAQAIHPRLTRERAGSAYINLDFRVHAAPGQSNATHRLTIGGMDGGMALEVRIGMDSISLETATTSTNIGTVELGKWQNLQLQLDLESGTVAGRWGAPGTTSEIAPQPFDARWSGAVELVRLDSGVDTTAGRPAIDFDNLAIQTTPIPAVSTEPPAMPGTNHSADLNALTGQLQTLAGIDGDFELQTDGLPPATPWGPGPNSVVKLAASAQSPFRNIFAPGKLGIHLPNRGEYDGFGMGLPAVKPSERGQLFVGFDFRCASQARGGDGSWRYYLGHGPGQSAAVELFFNGGEFFRRSGDDRDVVATLEIGRWYQVQLILDLPAKSYTGVLASSADQIEFSGKLASNWDETIDYTFIDSYGHRGGVRPALDADNFVIQDVPLPPFDGPAKSVDGADDRRRQVTQLRDQIAALLADLRRQSQELEQLLSEGPLPLAYGVTEGTPHDARIQQRGEPDQPGDKVPRGFIQVLGAASLPPETKGSGRWELAQWLTRSDQPLTARVIANRIWQYHFGRGLVKTPNDFGSRGLAPTHPELLDHLAAELVRSGWSIKALHRRIMLSATYQQQTAANVASTATDLTDLYVGFPRRRLGAEEIRDSILMVSGQLDSAPRAGHPFPSPIQWAYTQHGPFRAVYDHNGRSVYLMTQRIARHPFLALFDGADPNASTPNRLETTVPTQSLYFLNDSRIHAQAEAWATNLRATTPDDAGQIDLAWQQAYGRTPSDEARREALDFLSAYRSELTAANAEQVELRALAAYLRTIFASNEFLHVD